MSLDGFAATRDFYLRPSRWLTVGLAGGYGLALISAWAVLPFQVAFVVSSLILVSAGLFLRNHWMSGRVTRLTHLERGEWSLTQAAGRQCVGRLMPGAFITRGLVILRFRCGLTSRHVIVLPDSLPWPLRRRLIVRVRFS
ncbi:MAG: protein YgfX [Pseudomonadota bacterium]|nr:protein YgfX [Pseudomonadota bacterium]